jgi:hypothetical protein
MFFFWLDTAVNICQAMAVESTRNHQHMPFISNMEREQVSLPTLVEVRFTTIEVNTCRTAYIQFGAWYH